MGINELNNKNLLSKNLKIADNDGVCKYSCCDICACDNETMRKTLYQMGMPDGDIKIYFDLPEQCADEKNELLKKCRKIILNGIHDKQKTLDIIDYLTYYNRKRRKING